MKIKKIFLSLFAIIPLVVFAQETKDSVAQENAHVFYVDVPKQLNIKDKIIVRNRSPYLIMQAVVALADNGILTPLGTISHIVQGEACTVVSFKDNGLKKLRGKTIAIKVKGAKIFAGQNKTNVGFGSSFGFGGISVGRKELPADVVNNIKPEDITYNFDASLFESSHDLYIDIISSGENGKGIMDF